MAIQIIHEDDHIIAVAKPSGQVVIPGRGDLSGEPLQAEVERHLGRKAFVIHRLDRGASGVVLFAKDADTHRHLNLRFENRQVRKSYLVLVSGRVETNGCVDQPLRAFGSGRMGIHPEGKVSCTEFEVLERLLGATLLRVTPLTGRRHQIRVHLYWIGHAVYGDTLYGKDRPVGGASRLMLHAWKIEFERADGQRLSIQADPTQDYEEILARLRPA